MDDFRRASLERQRYRFQRQTILRELEKYLKEPDEPAKVFDKIGNIEFAPDDLARFIK